MEKAPVTEKSKRKSNRPPPKRTWRRPQVKTGQLFESNSLACGKTHPATEECGFQTGMPQAS
jgi:hypothetical protein